VVCGLSAAVTVSCNTQAIPHINRPHQLGVFPIVRFSLTDFFPREVVLQQRVEELIQSVISSLASNLTLKIAESARFLASSGSSE
jgi:hypothetical protein